MKYLFIITACIIMAYSCSAQTTIAACDAGKHIGKTVSITDEVFDSNAVAGSGLTAIEVGSLAASRGVMVIIPDADKSKFSKQPEVDYKGRRVTVTGKLVSYKDKPAIIVKSASQFKLAMIDNVREPLLKQKN